jgi:hypothetical protein
MARGPGKRDFELRAGERDLEVVMETPGRRGHEDAAMQKVTHDPVARRPIVSMGGGVIGAEPTGAKRRVAAQGAHTHRTLDDGFLMLFPPQPL